MKTIPLLLAALGFPAASTVAQTHFLDRFAVVGGGGVSAGGGYTLTGAIGQPHPGPMAGGGFTLTVGVSGSVTVTPAPEAPLLTAQRTAPQTITIAWPALEGGWKLQTTENIFSVPVVWTDVAVPHSPDQGGRYTLAPSSSGSRFYRLYRP